VVLEGHRWVAILVVAVEELVDQVLVVGLVEVVEIGEEVAVGWGIEVLLAI
jgi:hypothetical protein